MYYIITKKVVILIPKQASGVIQELRNTVGVASFFFGVYSWLVKVLGQFSIIYFRGLGLRIGVRVWVGVRVRVSVV